jgi:hypothetical protein
VKTPLGALRVRTARDLATPVTNKSAFGKQINRDGAFYAYANRQRPKCVRAQAEFKAGFESGIARLANAAADTHRGRFVMKSLSVR